MKTIYYQDFATPLGDMLAVADAGHLTGLYFQTQKNLPQLAAAVRVFEHPVLLQVTEQLAEYFQAKRSCFDIALVPCGSVFQQKVRAALTHIPYGQTSSYQTLAQSLGYVNGARAVAHAIACNPYIIIVPCHRVIGSDGSLRGYAGGIERKHALLELERQQKISGSVSQYRPE